LAVTAATGPLFDLFMGLICTLSLWRFRRLILLSLLMWEPVAMVQEWDDIVRAILPENGYWFAPFSCDTGKIDITA
jgi:hypothetical protein